MDALALLRLQIEWGADEALDDAPVDRLAPEAPAWQGPAAARPGVPHATDVAPAAHPAAAHGAAPQAAARAVSPAAAPPRGTAAERALAAAGAADSIPALCAAITAFDGCALRDTATQPVLPQGNADTGLLLIGEPPGADEDRSGTPFAGENGALLDRMLGSIGLERGGLLLAPLIPWRPPGGRPPTPGELTVCLPFLQRLIVLAEPRYVVLLGSLAARMLLDGKRRKPGAGWTELSVAGLSAPVPALALPSPEMLRSTPKLRRDTWADWRRLRRALDGEASH